MENEKLLHSGDRFYRLTVIERAANDKFGNAQYLCRCDCGRFTTANASRMRSGKTRSCGCLQKESASMLLKTHGESKTRLYRIWTAMRYRCANQNNAEFDKYGGRGISVDAEWLDFNTFRNWAISNGYSDDLTIDRIDNNKGYSPNNCRWTTREEQNRNTSRTHRIIDGDGNYLTAAQVGRIIGVNRSSVAKWARNGEIKTLQDAIEREQKICNGRYKR